MEEGFPFIYPFSDFMLNIAGLALFFTDLALDIWAVVNFYQEEAYIAMGMLIFLLLGSSVLLHTYSWLWYNNELKEESEGLGEYVYLEKYFRNRRLLGVLHVFQLGVFFRFASMMEISVRTLISESKDKQKQGIAVFLTHDLSFLRFIETFAESAPQLTLMIAFIERREDVEWVTGLKTLGSIAAISFSVVSYHRSMRAFLDDKAKMTWTSSLVFFLWNFLLIAPRVSAIALYASTMTSGLIAVHFICLWTTLFVWARLQKTEFMEDNPNWEWLYQATVALIWYFSWFNVSKNDSRDRSIIYHLFIAVDITILLGLWGLYSDQDTYIFGLPAMWVFISAGSSYVMGIIVKILYHKYCHPKKLATEKSADEEEPGKGVGHAAACIAQIELFEEKMSLKDEMGMDVPDFPVLKARSPSPPPEPPKKLTAAERRMKRLADNFYS